MRVILFSLAFVCLTATVLAAPATQQWIDQLGADDPADRDSAEVHLRATGQLAIPALRTATSDPRPEISFRARRTLRQIQLFLLPDAPGESLSIADRYLNAEDVDHKKTQLNRLFEIQPQPDAVLSRLVVLEQDEDARRQILYRLRTGYRDAVCRWLAIDEDPGAVLQLLDGASSMWGRAASADYAAALQLTGGTQRQIQICQAEYTNGDSDEKERAARQLCFLYRMDGKSHQALLAARESKEPSLIFLVLSDMGDWESAAKEPDDRWHDPMLAATFRAAYQRLAGQNDKAVETMSTLLPTAAPDPDESYTPSKYFLLNDLPDRGMDLLVEHHPAAVFAMRVARGEVSAALDIASRYSNHPLEGQMLMKMREDLRRTLGELPDLQTADTQPPPAGPIWKAWKDAVNNLSAKKYQLAADQFRQMWEIDHTHYDRLYLQGYALNAAGQTQQGQALMHTAEMIPLGDPLARWQLAAQLDAAGLPDAAEQQRVFGLRTGADFDEIGFSEIYNTRASNAMLHKQWHIAADAIDRLCLIDLSPQVQWPDAVRLLTVPALAHLLKSRDARERGDLSAALHQLQIYQQYLPASADMILEWVPALDDLGEHNKADDLFNGVYEKMTAICNKYPASITYQNQIAWMCACCGRRLDEALTAAQTAVRLKPNSWQTMDTLAEVTFRRGDRSAAITLEKQALALSNDPYLTRQLKRFESGVMPSTTQPGVAPE